MYPAERATDGGLSHTTAKIGIHDGRRGLFDDFLVAPLDGAFSFAERDAVAVFVSEDLDFNVAGTLDEFFEVDFAGTEGAFGLTAGGSEGGRQVIGREDRSHAFATAARSSFEHDRISHASGDVGGFLGRRERVNAARSAGHACFVGGLARVGLGAEHAHGGGRRTDKFDSSVLAGLGEVGVFRKEAVTGVDGTGTGTLCNLEDQIATQIGLRGGSGTESISLIRFEHVRGGAVSVGIDGDSGESEFTAGAQNAEGNFAAIRDENFAKHLKQGTGSRVQRTGKMRSPRFVDGGSAV